MTEKALKGLHSSVDLVFKDRGNLWSLGPAAKVFLSQWTSSTKRPTDQSSCCQTSWLQEIFPFQERNLPRCWKHSYTHLKSTKENQRISYQPQLLSRISDRSTLPILWALVGHVCFGAEVTCLNLWMHVQWEINVASIEGKRLTLSLFYGEIHGISYPPSQFNERTGPKSKSRSIRGYAGIRLGWALESNVLKKASHF